MSKDETSIIKGIAIFLMIWHHMFWTDNTNMIFQCMGYLGKTCVVTFIILSAYGLSNKQIIDYRDYLSNRMGKFLANYWFVILFTLLLFLTMYIFGISNSIFFKGMNKLGFFARLIACLSGMQYLLGFKGFLSPWWYVTFSMIIYFLYPFVKEMYIHHRKKYIVLMIILIAFSFSSMVFNVSMPIFELTGYFSVFMFGIVCSAEKIYAEIQKKLGITSILLLIFVSIIRAAILKMNMITMWLEVIIATLLITTTKLMYTKKKMSKISNILSFVGKHSGNMFLFHMAIIQMFSLLIIMSDCNKVIQFFLVSVASLLFSVLFEKIKLSIRWNRMAKIILDKFFYFSFQFEA